MPYKSVIAHQLWRAVPALHFEIFMVDEHTIQELCDPNGRDFQPERIILFGSYASGNPTPDSEVDLLVVMNFEGKKFWKSLDILYRTNSQFPIDLLRARMTPEAATGKAIP